MVCLCMISVFAGAQDSDEQQIRSILDRQVAAWNSGDLRAFMNGYWENDSLMGFNSGIMIYRSLDC